MEVHGRDTQNPPVAAAIMKAANHQNVGACWNSNPTDVVNGSVKPSFDLLRPWIRNCHINELVRAAIRIASCSALLAQSEYQGYTLCEARRKQGAGAVPAILQSIVDRIQSTHESHVHCRRSFSWRWPLSPQPPSRPRIPFRARNRRRSRICSTGTRSSPTSTCSKNQRPHPGAGNRQDRRRAAR